MFPSKFPLLPALHMIGVVIAVIVGLLVTYNPLFLMGFFFMPQVPIMEPEECPDPDMHTDTSYQTAKIGFGADVDGPQDRHH